MIKQIERYIEAVARRNAELFYYGEHSKGGAKW
jgi:hypothetical protein